MFIPERSVIIERNLWTLKRKFDTALRFSLCQLWVELGSGLEMMVPTDDLCRVRYPRTEEGASSGVSIAWPHMFLGFVDGGGLSE